MPKPTTSSATKLELKVKELLENAKYNEKTAAERKEWLVDENGMELVEIMARANMSEIEIAHDLKISQIELNQLCRDYPLFSDSIAYGRKMRYKEVENAMYKSATGYVTTETHTSVRTVGGREIKLVDTYEKEVPPNPMMNQFAQTNLWKTKYQQKVESGNPADIGNITVKVQVVSNDGNDDCPIPK
jgi:hypothetical protein